MLLFPNFQSIYLENKHLSSKHGNCVKVPFTDIGSIMIWSFCGPGAVWLPRRCLRWPRLWTTGCHSGQGLGGAAVWLTCRKKQTLWVKAFLPHYAWYWNTALAERDKDCLKTTSLKLPRWNLYKFNAVCINVSPFLEIHLLAFLLRVTVDEEIHYITASP